MDGIYTIIFAVVPYICLMSGWIQEEYVVLKHLLKQNISTNCSDISKMLRNKIFRVWENQSYVNTKVIFSLLNTKKLGLAYLLLSCLVFCLPLHTATCQLLYLMKFQSYRGISSRDKQTFILLLHGRFYVTFWVANSKYRSL